MHFAPDNTSVMTLIPKDAEAMEVAALENDLAKCFPTHSFFVRRHTLDQVALGKQGGYTAEGVKRVYEFLAQMVAPGLRNVDQEAALTSTVDFIRKFDRNWQPRWR